MNSRLKKWAGKHFAFSHALAGVCAYSLAILLVNLDKSWFEISALVSRQALMTFVFTGLLVPRVQRRATSDQWLVVAFWGVLVPATIVVIASTLAHRYFSDEDRNILAPFLVSIVLNSCLVAARRAGHETFGAQIHWFWRLLIGPVR